MAIIGIGTEIVECVRIARMIEKHGELFLTRVFSEEEMLQCQSRRHTNEFYTAYWAGKEAVFKALNFYGRPSPAWLDLRIETPVNGSPKVRIVGATAEEIRLAGVTDVMLTMAYCRNYATATAIAVGVPIGIDSI